MSTILVFGHKNPDNDAIMSAVVLAQLLGACDPDNDYVARRLGPLPKESAELLAECGFEEPELLESIPAPAEGEQPQKVVLCDHNESAQSVDGLASAEIAGVVDHHRIGDVHTAAPVAYVAMPWGSTCSIVYRLFGVLGVEPTDAQAKCLLSAMMTDMVMLKSPTTTEADRGFVAELGAHLGIDPVEFGMRIFLSRPQLAPEQMVSTDIKEFEVGSQRILIGQYETVSKDAALSQLAEDPRRDGGLPRAAGRRRHRPVRDRHHGGGQPGPHVRRHRGRRARAGRRGLRGRRVDARRALPQEAGGRPHPRRRGVARAR